MNITSRQSILLAYLQDHPGFNKQADILNALELEYGTCFGPTFHDSTPRLLLTADIRALRESGAAAIISNRRGIRLATKDENRIYHHARLLTLKRQLAREYRTIKELGLVDQLDTDGKVRAIVEENDGRN